MTASGPLPRPRPIDLGPSSVTPAHVGVDRRRQGTRPSVRTWVRRSFADRRLGSRLDRDLHAYATVLHHRQAASRSGSIDHLVVAATGIWVVTAVHDAASIERHRPNGAATSHALRLVGDARSDVFDQVACDVSDIETAIEAIGFGWVDVRPVMCLNNVDKGVRSLPFEVDGVGITWAKALVADIGRRGALAPRQITTLAAELSARFPALTP
jgi:hypothetical protein